MKKFSALVLGMLLASIPLQAATLPKLVVVLSIDQFRSDYLTRFEHLFVKPGPGKNQVGGFRYLMDQGAYFMHAHTAHAANMTGPGHAAMLTGAVPTLHGIISNYWFDGSAMREVYCVEDEKSPLLDGKGGFISGDGRSPRNLLTTTVGDEIKNLFGGKSKLVSVALKDRAAILMAGHRADHVIWLNDKTGQWTTSKFYAPDGKLPDWINKWNASANLYLQKQVPSEWNYLLEKSQYWLSTKLPEKYIGSSHKRLDLNVYRKNFPHHLEKSMVALFASPWGADYTLKTALEAVRELKMGSGPAPDMLTVSISSHDYIAHMFSPMSEEMQDTTLREDRFLADFFEKLFQLVPGGKDNVTIILTADHGAGSALTSYQKELHLPGGPYFLESMPQQIGAFLKKSKLWSEFRSPVAEVVDGNVFFDLNLVKSKGVSLAELSQATASWLREQPYIAEAYTKQEALSGKLLPTEFAKRLAKNLHPLRSGEVIFASRPGWIEYWGEETESVEGLDHENISPQDGGIPLVFVGKAFVKKRFWEEASMSDLAPTLSAALGILAPSGSEGRILSQAMRP